MNTEDLMLHKLAPGCGVITVTPRSGGAIQFGSQIYTVLDFVPELKRWRYTIQPGGRVAGCFPADGGGRHAMSENDGYDFFYSANPLHINAARNCIAAAKVKAQRQTELDKRHLGEFQEKLKALCHEYDVWLYPTQTAGDDQGVEMEIQAQYKTSGITLTS
jgi:hypothetical protein